MFEIVLYEPEIPPNTGNIIRLCANSGANLHLIEPLGFSLDEKRVRRAGLDYADMARVQQWPDFGECRESLSDRRWFALSSKVTTSYADAAFQPGDVLLFGPETRGLPQHVLQHFDETRKLTIPMRKGSRSLNLSNSVALVLYEAWRQQGFATE